nr:hypothetical protein CFP56_42128 [Quercus suber]
MGLSRGRRRPGFMKQTRICERGSRSLMSSWADVVQPAPTQRQRGGEWGCGRNLVHQSLASSVMLIPTIAGAAGCLCRSGSHHAAEQHGFIVAVCRQSAGSPTVPRQKGSPSRGRAKAVRLRTVVVLILHPVMFVVLRSARSHAIKVEWCDDDAVTAQRSHVIWLDEE